MYKSIANGEISRQIPPLKQSQMIKNLGSVQYQKPHHFKAYIAVLENGQLMQRYHRKTHNQTTAYLFNSCHALASSLTMVQQAFSHYPLDTPHHSHSPNGYGHHRAIFHHYSFIRLRTFIFSFTLSLIQKAITELSFIIIVS